MEITFGNLEQAVVAASGSSTSIKVVGTVTLNPEKKVTNSNGRFEKVSDNSNIGSFNMYSLNQYNYNITENDLACDCINALNDYIKAVELKSSSLNLSI